MVQRRRTDRWPLRHLFIKPRWLAIAVAAALADARVAATSWCGTVGSGYSGTSPAMFP